MKENKKSVTYNVFTDYDLEYVICYWLRIRIQMSYEILIVSWKLQNSYGINISGCVWWINLADRFTRMNNKLFKDI